MIRKTGHLVFSDSQFFLVSVPNWKLKFLYYFVAKNVKCPRSKRIPLSTLTYFIKYHCILYCIMNILGICMYFLTTFPLPTPMNRASCWKTAECLFLFYWIYIVLSWYFLTFQMLALICCLYVLWDSIQDPVLRTCPATLSQT